MNNMVIKAPAGRNYKDRYDILVNALLNSFTEWGANNDWIAVLAAMEPEKASEAVANAKKNAAE